MCEALPWHKVSPVLRAANPLVLFPSDAVKRATPIRDGEYEWEQPSPEAANKTSLAFTQFARKLRRQT
jgi:hypothetical protein